MDKNGQLGMSIPNPNLPLQKGRPTNGMPLNRSTTTWYSDVTMNPGGEFNYGFWGAEAGQQFDPTTKQIHKYMEDAVSVNTFLEDTHFESHHVYRLEWQPGNTLRPPPFPHHVTLSPPPTLPSISNLHMYMHLLYLYTSFSSVDAALSLQSLVILHIFPLHPLPLFSPNDTLQGIP